MSAGSFTGILQVSEKGPKARFLVNKLGRFAQADTVIPGAANPQSLNRFAYVFNNPVNLIDPNGHDPYACFSDPQCATGVFAAYKQEGNYNQMWWDSYLERLAEKYNIHLPAGVKFKMFDNRFLKTCTTGGHCFDGIWGFNIEEGGNGGLVFYPYGSPEAVFEVSFSDDTVIITMTAYLEADLAGGTDGMGHPVEPGGESGLASVMVHESQHAWQEYLLEDPNARLGNDLRNIGGGDRNTLRAWREWDAYRVQLEFLEEQISSGQMPPNTNVAISTQDGLYGNAAQYQNLTGETMIPNFLGNTCLPHCQL